MLNGLENRSCEVVKVKGFLYGKIYFVLRDGINKLYSLQCKFVTLNYFKTHCYSCNGCILSAHKYTIQLK